MATENGNPPTENARKLLRKSYADRVLATLGEHRTITDSFIQDAIGTFNPDRVMLGDRMRMREDPTCKMGLFYRKAPLLSADWTIQCEDAAIAAGVTEIVEEVYQSWMRVALNSEDFGFQGAVKQYKYGKIEAQYENEAGDTVPVWDDEDVQPVVLGVPIPLPPQTTRVKLVKGKFEGILTPMALPPGASSPDDDNAVPPEWSLWFTREFEEHFRDYYGKSVLDPAYRAWWSFWFNWFNRDRHAEMDADPALQVWYPVGDFPTGEMVDGKPVKKNNRDAALEIGAMLRGGATIAWPSETYMDDAGRPSAIRMWEAAFLTGGENLTAFTELLNDLRFEKLRATMVPEEALTEAPQGTGSRATSGNRIDIFTQGLEQTAKYLNQIWNKYQLRAIVEANWGKDAPSCKIVTTGFKEEDMTLATGLIEAAFAADPNALPIDWEALVERAGLPTYSKKEQEERQQAADEAQQEQAAQEAEATAAAGGIPPVPGGTGGGGLGPLPGEAQPTPDPNALAAGQDRFRSKPRKYEREVIHLSSAPGWARREGQRRDRNVRALAERLQEVAFARYQDAFEAAADAIADTDSSEIQGQLSLAYHEVEPESAELSVARAAQWLSQKILGAIKDTVAGYRRPLEGELASMYHAAGMAELSRLGLSGESWDVGRDEVQEWARERAGSLITTIDKTVVEGHVRPWLAGVLGDPKYAPTQIEQGQGIPIDSIELAAQLTDKFSAYPQWMAERLVRTEAAKGYNLSAADMWERVGVDEVEMFDGLGGRTGKTDAECLARNGQRATLDEFREFVLDEHPNGTLGAIPVTVGATLKPLEPGLIGVNAAQSESIYAITDAGLILSQDEVGRALAGE